MKSQRPYLLRALYEWIVDSDTTPYLLVKVTSDEVIVPLEFVQDGQIVLNVSPNAVRDFHIGDEAIAFDGRFGGRSFDVWVPLASIAAIYAKENGQGMMFDRNDSPAAADESGSEQTGSSNEQVQDGEAVDLTLNGGVENTAPKDSSSPSSSGLSSSGLSSSGLSKEASISEATSKKATSKEAATKTTRASAPTASGRNHLKVVK